MAQTVKHLPAMWKTWVRSLGWEYSLEKGMATHSSTLAGKSHGQRSLVGYSPWGQRVGHDWSDLTHRVYIIQEEDYNHTLRDSDGALGWAIINSVALSGATNLLALYWASPWLRGKDSTANVEDTGDSCLIPGLRRSPGGGHENPLQYSCPENPMDRGAWWAIPWGH